MTDRDGTVRLVARKSWMAYARSAIGTGFALAAWGVAGLVALAAESTWATLVIAGLALLTLVGGVYRLLVLRSIRWTLTDDHLRIRRGVLPWSTSDYRYPYDTIFEAYYTFGLFAKLFGYGEVVIRRTEGLTSAESEPHVADPGAVVRLINARVEELRKAGRGPVVAVPSSEKSAVEQLAELARLRVEGHVSERDYEVLKGRIVGTSSGAPAAGPRPEAADSRLN